MFCLVFLSKIWYYLCQIYSTSIRNSISISCSRLKQMNFILDIANFDPIIFLTIGINVFALVGLVGSTTVPMRTWHFFAQGQFRTLISGAVSDKLIALTLSALSIRCLFVLVNMVSRVRVCLMGDPCGPNRAHGMILLAIYGVYVIAFESGFWVSKHLRFWKNRTANSD